jgi:hypothetical protein
MVTTEGEKDVIGNLQRKAVAADRMFSSLVAEMDNALHLERSNVFTTPTEVPEWMSIA